MAAPLHQPGDSIATSGIYRVVHSVPHEGTRSTTLLQGESFPRCTVCGEDVCYLLVVSGPAEPNL